MKKFLKIAVLAVILAICMVGLIACNDGDAGNGKVGLQYKVLPGDDYYTVTKYYAKEGEPTLDIGDFNKDGVVIGRIMSGAFDGNSTLTELVIPDSVTKIDAGALKGMQKLQKLTIPFVGETAISEPTLNYIDSTEKSIGMARTFGNLFGSEKQNYNIKVTQKYNEGTSTQDYYVPISLTEVTISPKENYNIPMFAFSGNTVLAKINLSDKVIGIGENAFEDCTALTSLTNVAKVKKIYKNAFKGAKKFDIDLTTFVDLREVCDNAFENSGITNVVMNSNVMFGNRVFKNSNVKTASVNVEMLPYGTFYGCVKLETVAFNGTISVESYALANLHQTKTVALTGITSSAFVDTTVTDNSIVSFN